MVKSFASTSIDYDARIFSLNTKNWSVSVTLIGSREHIALAIGNYQRHLLAGQKPTSATPAKRKDGTYHLQIQVKSEPPEPPTPDGCMGVDLGRTDIAHTSTGVKFDGQQLKETRDRYTLARSGLQHRAAKGTRNKTERRRSNSWAFYQLRSLSYKAVKFGVSLVLVNPAYTSKTCHCCHRIGDRQGKNFKCEDGCGWHGDADLNGAMNIAQLGRLVDLPRGPWPACQLQGFQKPALYASA